MQEHDGISEVHVVEAWHAALNEGDVDRLVGLSHPDVEIGGPRGIDSRLPRTRGIVHSYDTGGSLSLLL